MTRNYLISLLSVASALVAPAAEVPSAVGTAADLLPLLRGVDDMPKEQARELLRSLPIPQHSSHVFREYMFLYKNLPRAIDVLGQLGKNSKEVREELLRESPRMWAYCLTVEIMVARAQKDEPYVQQLVAEGNKGLQQLGAEHGLGMLGTLGFSILTCPNEEVKAVIGTPEMIARLAENRANADSQATLALLRLYEDYNGKADVAQSMQHALQAAVAEMYLNQDGNALRNNLRLTLARAAYLQGEAALPLQLAALRQMEPGDKAQAGLGAYRLGKFYESLPENLAYVSDELARSTMVAGAKLGHPACLHQLSEYAEDEETRENMSRLATEAKYDPQKDYLHMSHGGAFRLSFYCGKADFPDRCEREAYDGLKRLMARVDMNDWLAGGERSESEAYKAIVPVFLRFVDTTFMAANERSGEQFVDYLDAEDSQEPPMNDFTRYLRKLESEFGDMEDVGDFFAQNAWVIESMSRAVKSGEGLSPEQVAVLKQFAEAGNADALYVLTRQQVQFLGSFTEESWGQMLQALQGGSADAAWFLFTALWEGEYGLDQDPMSATNCYRMALTRGQADAWARVRERAEDDAAARLYALVHMRHSSGGEKYSLQLDDELQAYAAAHPELKDIIDPLRLLYIGETLRKDTQSAAENHELRLRALRLAAIPQPSVLTPVQLDYWQRHAEFVYLCDLNAERASSARVALPTLKDNKADILLVVDKEVIYEQQGTDLASVPAEKLRGAHFVCRDCDRALADWAVQAGVRSVTALRMPAIVRDYLRGQNISAGGWEIVPE